MKLEIRIILWTISFMITHMILQVVMLSSGSLARFVALVSVITAYLAGIVWGTTASDEDKAIIGMGAKV